MNKKQQHVNFKAFEHNKITVGQKFEIESEIQNKSKTFAEKKQKFNLLSIKKDQLNNTIT